MALNFPASPTNNQVFDNWIYSSAKGAWEAKPLTPGVATPSPTAPLAPKQGDLWYNTEDGNTYVWYTDVDGSQWVQLKSDATLSSTLGTRVSALESFPAGLVPIVPSSVTVGSGSATVSPSGLVNFAGASSVSLNNVFTSQYAHYKIIAKYNGSVTTGISFRWRTAGVDRTVAAYYSSGWFARASSSANGYWSANATSLYDIGRVEITTDQRSFTMMDCFDPFDSTKSTAHSYQWGGQDANGLLGGFSNGGYLQPLQFDGFSIFTGAGNFTGTIEVFGYR